MGVLAALPRISSVEDAASFAHVVPAVWEAKDHFLQLIAGHISFGQFYVTTNPLATAFGFSLVVSVYTLILAQVTGNYSQVDRLWSLLPTTYILHFTYYAHCLNISTTRLDTVATIAVLWSARLTFNYWRKGGYTVGSEDYRWEIIKGYVGKPAFVVFNCTFISFMQNWLLLSIATPVYLLLVVNNSMPSEDGSSTTDLVFSRAMLITLFVEFFADQQQWNYQNAKSEYKKTGQVAEGYNKTDLERGFNVRGLFAFSRHPNFAAEQTIWVLLYQWSCFATNSLYSWTGLGTLSYLILFQGSTWFTEYLSEQKYPEYKKYKKLVGMFLPKIGAFTSSVGPFEEAAVAQEMNDTKKVK